MKKTIAILSFFLLLFACKKEEPLKVKYPKTEESIEFQKIDTTELQTTDLPIHIKGLDYLIHPIGKIRVKNNKGSYQYNNPIIFALSTYNYPQITGTINNIAFQSIENDSIKLLTDRKMHIHTITYLDEIIAKNNTKFLLYELYDIDTNKDDVYDTNDIKTLYLSNQNGENFIKISPHMQEVIDWKIIKEKNKLYFKTIEDINKNGIFDSKDIFNYFFIDFSKDEIETVKYNIDITN